MGVGLGVPAALGLAAAAGFAALRWRRSRVPARYVLRNPAAAAPGLRGGQLAALARPEAAAPLPAGSEGAGFRASTARRAESLLAAAGLAVEGAGRRVAAPVEWQAAAGTADVQLSDGAGTLVAPPRSVDVDDGGAPAARL